MLTSRVKSIKRITKTLKKNLPKKQVVIKKIEWRRKTSKILSQNANKGKSISRKK